MGYFGILLSVWFNIAGDFVDKTVSRDAQPKNLAFWTNVIQFFLILPLIGLVHPMALNSLVWCSVVGVITVFGRITWYRALAIHEQSLSRLSPFVRLSSAFVLVGAVFILHEPFNPKRFAGGCLLIVGSILALLDEPLTATRQLITKNLAPLFAIAYALSIAAVPLLYKHLVNSGEDLFSIYFQLKIFQALFIFLASASGAISILQTTSFKSFKFIVFARVLQTCAAIFYLYALSHLELSIAEPIAALGPFFVLVVEFAIGASNKSSTSQVNWSYRQIASRVTSALFGGIGLLLTLS